MEERQFKRHVPRQEVSVWLNLPPDGQDWFIGRLINICPAGLCFEYVAMNKRIVDSPDKDCAVFLRTDDLSISLSGTIVYDTSQGPTFILEMRRCGLQFKELITVDELNSLGI